jgi:recombinational DNA repair protein RecR
MNNYDNLGFCRECGNVKENKMIPLCSVCMVHYDEEFTAIRKYIRKNGDSNAMQVSRGTDISVERIMGFVRDGLIKINGK